ncbi:50S ribosomal protein L27, partial [Candidatus Gracilibacteria bacterium]|nr:50S ribosomal protein L27 [Candidatus Gracilibacteria bacterium]
QIIVPTAGNENNDLQLIEGIGPAIEKLLNKHDINSYVDIIAAGVSGLEEILEAGGSRFKIHVPTTWPDQARLANNQKWSELEEYQDILKAGK